MKSTLNVILLLTTFLFFGQSNSQCIIRANRNACVNDFINFSVTSGSGSILSCNWNFGSLGNSNNLNPTFKFTIPDTIIVRCTANLSSGATCTDTHRIIIRSNPKASLGVEKESKFCFRGNNVCLKNTSTTKFGFSSVNILWGDGSMSSSKTAHPANYCHRYSDTGTFKVNLEIADSNGCKDYFSQLIRIKPDILFNIDSQITNFCDSLKYCYTDKSSSSALIYSRWFDIQKKIGPINGSPFCLTLKPGEKVELKLVSINKEGCADSGIFKSVAPQNKIYIENNDTFYCRSELESGRVFLNANKTVQWTINGILLGSTKSLQIWSGKTGWNKVEISQTTPCPLTYTDSFYITTVRAVGRQFNVKPPGSNDTSVFLDLTPRPLNSRLLKIWLFKDVLAPACTTQTKFKQNIGLNCNYSLDSIATHYYKPGWCYYPTLFVYDSVSGCYDDTVFNVFTHDSCLLPGKASSIKNKICIGDGTDFQLNETDWLLVGKKNYLLTDNQKPRDSLVLTNKSLRYFYKTPGIKSPVRARFYGPDSVWVVRNGKVVLDKINAGKGWVLDTLKNYITVIPKPDSRFSVLITSKCNPFKVRVKFTDSIFRDPKILSVNWGDTIIKYNVSGSSFRLTELEHTYTKGGSYYITTYMENQMGCKSFSNQPIQLGFNMFVETEEKCGGLICFQDSITSSGNAKKWGSQNRAGIIIWNWGDGQTDTAFSPCHQYKKPGKYTVVLTAIDKTGCVQTWNQELNYSRPVAAIRYQPKIYCSEIRQYFDSSYSAGPLTKDTIQKWHWDFNDGSKPVSVQNPVHIFPSGGSYRVKLMVTTLKGCTDSIYRDIEVLGPIFKAEIISDSIGCNPLSVKFANRSKGSGTYIWEFGDPGLNFISTNRDTAVYFTYNKPGVYYAYLTGGDSFTNPTTGSKYFCSARYPQPGKPQMRITVLPTYKVSFTAPDTVCLNDSAEFVNTTLDTGIHAYYWKIDTAVRINSGGNVKYLFSQSGRYKVWMLPHAMGNKICVDTVSNIVEVLSFKPSFEWECSDLLTPELYLKNTSAIESNNYRWTELNPLDSSEKTLSISRDLRKPTDTGYKIICLSLNSVNYCPEKLCKTVQVKSGVFLANVFTPGMDGFNDVYEVPLSGNNDYSLNIFNRWGENIFSSTDINFKWNGQVQNNGPELPTGTYFYVLRFRDLCSNNIKEVNGSVNLIR